MKYLAYLADICNEDVERIDIIDGCVLRKAKGLEVDEIDNAVGKICEGFNRENPYYVDEESKFWVLENPTEIIKFAFSLSSLKIIFFADTSVEDDISFTTKYNQIQIATYFHDYKVRTFDFKDSNNNEVKRTISSLKELYNLEDFKYDYDFIIKAIKDFIELQKISKHSPFKILGLFSILELLLTHKPKNTEDSITRQIKTKINLINNRMDKPIDYLDYFIGKKGELEKIFNKLYDYRSKIAHGSTIFLDIKLKDNDKTNIYRFLLEITRKIILQAIAEPKLIKDLRMC